LVILCIKPDKFAAKFQISTSLSICGIKGYAKKIHCEGMESSSGERWKKINPIYEEWVV